MRLPVIAALLFTATGAYAANEPDGAQAAQVMRVLFDIPAGNPIRFSPQKPQEFPDFNLPPEFELLGGMSHPNFSRIAVSTTLGQNASMSLLSATLEENGYRVIPEHPAPERGFLPARIIVDALHVCHDERGRIQARALKHDGRQYIALTGSPDPGSGGVTCAELAADQQRYNDIQTAKESSGVRAYLPRLVLPEERSSSFQDFQPSNRFSGTDITATSVATVRSELSAEEIYGYFADQLRARQWLLEAEDSGLAYRQGEWQFINEDEHLISGSLQVTAQDHERLLLRITVTTSRDYYMPRSGSSPR